MTGVHVRPVKYLVTAWPEGHECSEASLWAPDPIYLNGDIPL